MMNREVADGRGGAASTEANKRAPISDGQAARIVAIRVLRLTFVAFLMTVTLLFILKGEQIGGKDSPRAISLQQWWYIPLIVAGVLALGVILLDEFTPKRISVFSGLFFGLIGGLIAAFAMSFVIDLLVKAYDINIPELIFAVKVILGICFCYLGIALVLRTQDDFRLVIPYVEFAKQMRGPKPMLLDSSALIDGRIADVAGTGFIQVSIVIPRFVILELQSLSDNSQRLIRARGKRGLEVVTRLQRTRGVDVLIDDTPTPGTGVDQMLVELAKILPATIVTADTGLNRVADIHGVEVLNLNEVANALKPSLIPGNRLTIRILKTGEQPGQGVGYLDDGTMVVVDNAAKRIDDDVHAEVTSSLQTSAGRLIFAKAVGDQAGFDITESRGGSPAGALGGAAADVPRMIARVDGVADANGTDGSYGARESHDSQQAARDVGTEPSDAGGHAPGMMPRSVSPPMPEAGQGGKGEPPPTKRFPRNPFRNPRR